MTRQTHRLLPIYALSVALASCGGSGGGDSEQVEDNSAESGDIVLGAGNDSTSLLDTSTLAIQRSAANQVAGGMGVNLTSLQRLSDDAMRNLEPDTIGADLVSDVDLEMLAALDSNNSNFMNNTLGLEGSNAVVQRDGNLITIDPDEQLICADELPILGMVGRDFDNCAQVLADMTVEILAHSDDSGVITYSHQNLVILSIGYSETSASYELQLEGLKHLSDSSRQLSGRDASNQGAVAGAVKLSTTQLSNEQGAVEGVLALEITEALSLIPEQGTPESITLQPSTVFEITINEATGDVTTRADWGTLQLMADISDNGDGSKLAELNLNTLTATASLNTNNALLKLSDVGIGGVPLTININQVNVVNLSLSTFDVSLDSESGVITFDGALGAALTLSNLMEVVDGIGSDATVSASVSAPAGTALRDEYNGSTRIMNNGPFAVSVSGSSGGVSLQESLSFEQGECFSAGDDEADVEINLVTVSCSQ